MLQLRLAASQTATFSDEMPYLQETSLSPLIEITLLLSNKSQESSLFRTSFRLGPDPTELGLSRSDYKGCQGFRTEGRPCRSVEITWRMLVLPFWSTDSITKLLKKFSLFVELFFSKGNVFVKPYGCAPPPVVPYVIIDGSLLPLSAPGCTCKPPAALIVF